MEINIGWIVGTLLVPVIGVLWKVWLDERKDVKALNATLIEQEQAHGAAISEMEKRHGDNRLKDALGYAENLEVQISTLDRAVSLIEADKEDPVIFEQIEHLKREHAHIIQIVEALQNGSFSGATADRGGQRSD